MNTNTNNDNTDSNTKAFNMNSMGKALDTPVDEWASSTLSALGSTTSASESTSTASPARAIYPSTMTTHPTMSATPTLGSASTGTPVYSHKFPNPNPTNTTSGLSGSDELPPPVPSKNNPFLEDHHNDGHKAGMTELTTGTTSVPSTSTFSPDIDLAAPAPTFGKELTTASTSTSTAHPDVHFAPTPATTHVPAAHNMESASTVTTPGLHVPGAYPGMEKERMTDGDLAMAKAATAVALERAKELARSTGETMMDVVDTVLPAVKAYMPSAQTTKEAAINAGQATANAGVAAGQTVGNTAANAASNIPEVHPVDTTKSYLSSAGDVIRGYVPASVGAYLPGSAQPTTTLPSQETGQNAHPASSSGVGTLPGPPGEIGVAVLPDERTGGKDISDLLHSTPNSQAEHKPTHLGGVGTLPGEAGESGVAVLPEERNRSKLPSSQAGLGLPGAKDEAGVAVLPIERGAEEHHNAVAFIERPSKFTTDNDDLLSPTPGSNAASTLNGASANASIRTLVGSRKEQLEQNSNPITTTTNTVPHPEPNAIPNPALNEDNKTSFKSSADAPVPAPALTTAAAPVSLVGGVIGATTATTDGDGNAGVDGVGYAHGLTREDQHAHAAPAESHVERKNRQEAQHQDSTTATQGHGSPFNAADANTTSHTKSESTSSNSSAGKKPSLFNKMKGEMKVLSGKIGHNEDKIEEGRRMMGKPLN
ncbi:hypothetical protein D9619_009414 [Psilocybe cf. subviscida]|uniref:Uncharacterized protein n=1 Tax=Psilocybe cf. subviscida TaxID=2480587 RepID=A0A8H5BTZ9_9AGAR|nr:hypothetical protein D9619_009414 [Psilocybe cf. subviscida]